MNVLRRQLRAMAVKAQLVTATSNNYGPLVMVIARIVPDQGPISTMGTDVRAMDEAHPHHQAKVFRTAQVMGEVGAMARTRRGKVNLQTLVIGTKTSVPGRGTVVHNAMDLPGTSGSITMVEVVDKDMATGDVGTTSKASTNLKVKINRKVGTNNRANNKVNTHLQVNRRIKVSTSRVLKRDRHHRTRHKTEEVDIKDKATIKVKVAILTSKGWK